MIVNPMLTEEQAELVHQALIAFLNSPEGQLSTDPGEEHLIKQSLSELVYFFSEVVENPEKFPVRSEKEAKAIIRSERRLHNKGPALPKSRRKRRQAERTGHKKRSRREKREEAEQYNKARLTMETEQSEAQAAYEEAMKQRITRFEAIAQKERISNEELQDVLEMFGASEGVEAIKQIREHNDPQFRLDAAAAARAAEDHA